MQLRARILALLLAGALLAGLSGGCDGDGEEAGEPAPFGYGAEDGPSRWSSLDPAYEECAKGRRQSPVDLRDGTVAALPRLAISYHPAELEAENNGHSIEAEYPPGSTLEVGGKSYELKQFHFHAPSEHRIGGRSAPIEFHLVHESEGGELLVLGALVEEGRPNRTAATLVEALPAGEGQTLPTPRAVNALDLLPGDPSEARRWVYSGSLTTPPCSEGIEWHVFDKPVELSVEQIGAYTEVFEGTNRPVQKLHGRTVRLSRQSVGG